MADTVRGIDYYYVTVPDAPGEGQRILSSLKDGGVNLLAFLGFPLGGGQSQIDLVPEDPESLRDAAQRAGIHSAGRSGRFSSRATTAWVRLPTSRRSSRRRTSI
jgi:hypothetical protein